MIKGVPCAPYESIRLKGLDSAAVYVERTTGKQYSGEALMHIGLKRRCSRDYSGEILVLDKM